jgi:hypothetical protein
MSFRAARLEPPKRPAWARCLITSVGTRTAQAAISPREEAREWVRIMWVRDWGSGEPGGGRRARLTPS